MQPISNDSNPPALHPTQFVIFGITGDLASRKLLPALLTLYAKRLLPPRFTIIGFSRRSFSREEFREYIRERLKIKPGEFKEEDVKHFLDHLTYEQGMFDDPRAYERLAERMKGTDDRWGQCSNKLFHLSVPPTLYEGILNHIASSGLSLPCADDTGWTRILIEKPFGSDIDTARALDNLLGKLFKEEQIFRIDHYLAKEALQNIIAFRFSNSIFEPLWDSKHIDKIHIKLFEKNGMEGRGAFYDPIGALKDVGQNHMLQMLALVTMDKPRTFSSASIRKERSKVISKISAITKRSLSTVAVKGQYLDYTSEPGVAAHSQTETYFRIKVGIDSARWKNVPMYLESGKGFIESQAEISVYFKPTTKSDMPNILTFRIQPDEGIKIRFLVKRPGYGFDIEPKVLKFKYADVQSFTDIPDDYERLIHDAIIGDQTLFASTDEIMSSWKFIASFAKGWAELPLVKYPRGVKEIG